MTQVSRLVLYYVSNISTNYVSFRSGWTIQAVAYCMYTRNHCVFRCESLSTDTESNLTVLVVLCFIFAVYFKLLYFYIYNRAL